MIVEIPEFYGSADIGYLIEDEDYLRLRNQIEKCIVNYVREWPSNTDFPFARCITNGIIEDVLSMVNIALEKYRSVK